MWASFFKGLVTPITGLVSEFIEDKDKANELQVRITEILDGAAERADKYATALLEAKASIIKTEATGSWLQRSWRPLMMLWFAFLLGMYWFGVAPEGLTQEDKTNLFDLLKLGIGGYIVGRSAEKIVPVIADRFRNTDARKVG